MQIKKQESFENTWGWGWGRGDGVRGVRDVGARGGGGGGGGGGGDI